MDKLHLYYLMLVFLLLARSADAADYSAMSLEQLGEVDVFSSSVLQAHIHQANDVMLAYHYRHIQMNDMGDNTSRLSSAQVLSSYLVTPLEMDMDMHMLHFMYAPSDETTLMLMFEYMQMSMSHETTMGGRFTTRSQGIGDTEIALNHVFNRGIRDDGSYRWFFQGGVILPTGDIDAMDETPAGLSQLPYAMQTGAGSFQLMLGLGLDHIFQQHSFGQLLILQSPLNDNDANYRVGEYLNWRGWYQRSLSDQFSLDLGLEFAWQYSISGYDLRLDPALVPTADPNNYGGKWFDASVGISYTVDHTNKLGIHLSVPAWQDLNGPQLRRQWELSLSMEVQL